jgi:hypothetical protein
MKLLGEVNYGFFGSKPEFEKIIRETKAHSGPL